MFNNNIFFIQQCNSKQSELHQSDEDASDPDDSRSSHNSEVMNLLLEYKQRKLSNANCDIKLEIDENSLMSVDDSTQIEILVKFDDDAIISLCQIFNRQEKWKRLASSLNYAHQINFWESSSNPTKMLLREIEKNETTITQLINVFQNIKETDAVNEIDAMIARQSEPDF